MKKAMVALLFGILIGNNLIADQIEDSRLNGVCFKITDLLKTSLSSLYGNIGISRNINDKARHNVGVSASYQLEEDVLSIKNSIMNEYGIGCEISLIRINNNKDICSYIGLGLEGGLSNRTSKESNATGNQSYYINNVSGAIFLPVGIELNIENKYRIGIMNKISGAVISSETKAIAISGSETSETRFIYSIDVMDPVLYFSIWL